MATKEVTVKINVDGKGAIAGINGISDKLSSIKGQFQAVGAMIGLGWAAGKIKDEVKAIADLQDVSDRLGVSTSMLQEWTYAASETGVTLEQLAGAYAKFQKAAIEAVKDPTGNEAQAFKRYGFGIDEIKRLDPKSLFYGIASGMQAAGVSTQTTADSMVLFGKSGFEVLPAMVNNFARLTQEAENLGAVIDENVVSALDDMLDRLTQLKQTWIGRSVNWVYGGVKDLGMLFDSISSSSAFSRDTPTLNAGFGFSLAQNAISNIFGAATGTKRKQKTIGESIPTTPTPVAEEKFARFAAQRIQSDTLARIGGFNGSQDRQIQMQQKQLQKMDTQISELRRIYSALSSQDPVADGMWVSGSGFAGSSIPSSITFEGSSF